MRAANTRVRRVPWLDIGWDRTWSGDRLEGGVSLGLDHLDHAK